MFLQRQIASGGHRPASLKLVRCRWYSRNSPAQCFTAESFRRPFPGIRSRYKMSKNMPKRVLQSKNTSNCVQENKVGGKARRNRKVEVTPPAAPVHRLQPLHDIPLPLRLPPRSMQDRSAGQTSYESEASPGDTFRFTEGCVCCQAKRVLANNPLYTSDTESNIQNEGSFMVGSPRKFALEVLFLVLVGWVLSISLLPFFESTLKSYVARVCVCRKNLIPPLPVPAPVHDVGALRGQLHWFRCSIHKGSVEVYSMPP